MQTISLEKAVAMISDGASFMIGGFMVLAVIAFPAGRATLMETAPGVTVEQVVAATEAALAVPDTHDAGPVRALA